MTFSKFCIFKFKTYYIFLVPKRGGAYIREGAFIRENTASLLLHIPRLFQYTHKQYSFYTILSDGIPT